MPDELNTFGGIDIPQQAPDMAKLRKMMQVAQMRGVADQMGAGFVGGWMDEETGEVFMQTNMEEQRGQINEFLRTFLPDNAQLPNE